jgi:hypothetical protein
MKKGTQMSTAVALYTAEIGSFYDSFQPTGKIVMQHGLPHIEMKKMHHKVFLTVEGLDNVADRARECLQHVIAEAMLTAIVVAITTGGAGLGAAVGVVEAAMTNCVGVGINCKVRAEDDGWVKWLT